MNPTRREAIKAGVKAGLTGAGAIAAAAAFGDAAPLGAMDRSSGPAPLLPARALRPAFVPGFKQSVARWCFASLPLADLCRESKRIGLDAVDLLSENEFEVPKAHGLICAIANGPGPIADGWNRPDLHDKLVAEGTRLLPLVAKAGIPQMIVFSGNKKGMSDGEGIANCVTGIKRLIPAAERHGVTLVMEMLNSRVDHRDYHADRTEWAAQVARGIGSERFKLLYDVYHMQIMEGDVVRTIETYAPLIAHYHTAGVPGRHEIDDTQELNYSRIARAINGTGFQGFVAHEFMPTASPIVKLDEARGIFAGA